MTPLLFLGVALAGGLGAVCRFLLDELIRHRVATAYPWGTTVVNLSGSLLLGLVLGLGASLLGPEAQLVIGAGFLGGYTTFSTASVETVRLVRSGRRGTGLMNAFGQLAAAIGGAGLGLLVGSMLTGSLS